MNQNSIKALSIQINLSGLSFCILNRSTNSIELLNHIRLKKKATPYELLNELKKTIDSNASFQDDFNAIFCIYQNELSSLVPKALFDKNHLADYLKFNAKILRTDFISYDTLIINDSINVYVPLININNYIFETFGSFVYKHSSTVLIETLLQSAVSTSQEIIHININSSTFEIIGIKNKKLIFYNTFEYSSKEDFIYYILFTIEQLKLSPETIKTFVSGQIEKDDELYSILYTYIRFVEFANPTNTYNMEASVKNDSKHNDYILLNSFN